MLFLAQFAVNLLKQDVVSVGNRNAVDGEICRIHSPQDRLPLLLDQFLEVTDRLVIIDIKRERVLERVAGEKAKEGYHVRGLTLRCGVRGWGNVRAGWLGSGKPRDEVVCEGHDCCSV
jgi:hypothetical protein